MATSRTGTASHKRWRRHVLREAQQSGVTNCPTCNTELDYTKGLQPNSAEPDHLIPWTHGGRNTPDNGRVTCRLCNQKRGNKPIQTTAPTKTITTLITW